MTMTRMTGRIQTATVSLLLAVTVALLLGAMIPNDAAAFKAKAKGVSVSNRVQGQKDLCWAGGGSTAVYNNTGPGQTTTVCRGGVHDGMTCTNSKTSTSCDMSRTVQLGMARLAEVLAGSDVTGGDTVIAPDPDTAPTGDTSGIGQDTVTEQALPPTPEPTSTPSGPLVDDAGAITEEAPVVAPEPTGTPASDAPVIADGSITDETLAIDPGTDGDAQPTDQGGSVEVGAGDGSVLPVLTVDEQQ
jgi:hypothetical protein